MNLKDYYKILNVPNDASLNTIKKSFREKAIKLHPDKNKAPNAKADFQELIEAYEILSKPKKRAAYDNLLKKYRANTSVVLSKEETTFEEHQKEAEKNSKKYTEMSWEDFLALDIILDLGLGLSLIDGTDLLDDVGDVLGDIFDIF